MSGTTTETPRASLDFSQRVATRAERRDRIAELVRRDREHGGLTPYDRDRETRERAMRGWCAPYRAELTRSELERIRRAARAGIPLSDFRTIDVKRLDGDIRRAAGRWIKADSAERDAIASRALMLLIRWSEHGSEPTEEHPRAERIDLGGKLAESMARRAGEQVKRERRAAGDPRASALATLRVITELERVERLGSLPMRRVWLDAERVDRSGRAVCTRGALRAMRAALKQARAELRAELESVETPSGDTSDFSDAIERDRAERAAPENLPDVESVELLSHLLDVSRDAARVIIARGYPHALDTLAVEWSLSPASLKVALSRGAAALRARYPDGRDLLAAMRAIVPMYHAETERRAIVALSDWRDGRRETADARRAVNEWRGAARGMSDAERAHLGAARLALKRETARAGRASLYGDDRAARVADSATRLLDAERTRLLALKVHLGKRRQSEALARTYPGASWRVVRGRVLVSPARVDRSTLDAESVAERLTARRELDRLTLADVGMFERGRGTDVSRGDKVPADADRVAALRAVLGQRAARGWLTLADWSAVSSVLGHPAAILPAPAPRVTRPPSSGPAGALLGAREPERAHVGWSPRGHVVFPAQRVPSARRVKVAARATTDSTRGARIVAAGARRAT